MLSSQPAEPTLPPADDPSPSVSVLPKAWQFPGGGRQATVMEASLVVPAGAQAWHANAAVLNRSARDGSRYTDERQQFILGPGP